MNSTPRSETVPSPAARRRILVVEDDQDTALFLRHVLESRGQFEVTHTPDPAAALALVVDEPWDLVVTDLELPGMNGLELVAALRRLVPSLPVLIVTPHATGVRGIDYPVLTKPLRVEELLSTVTALIGDAW
jgi:DNA-binding response OmpR family regulator